MSNNQQQKHYPQIVIVRHGERADKYPHLLPLQEVNNPALTETGFLQAYGIGTLLRTSTKLPQSTLVHHPHPGCLDPGARLLPGN